MNELDVTFWSDKYQTNDTGWDIGYASTPIKTYIEQLDDKEKTILIPGCGNGYEAELLHKLGFKNVFVLDIATKPLENFSQRVPSFPKENLICANFFNFDMQFDLILEQTFFCALQPTLRKDYVKKMHQLLKDNGKLVGLLFNFPLTNQGPPFGGSKDEYLQLFPPLFTIKTLKESYNSINARQGKELFIIFEKS